MGSLFSIYTLFFYYFCHIFNTRPNIKLVFKNQLFYELGINGFQAFWSTESLDLNMGQKYTCL